MILLFVFITIILALTAKSVGLLIYNKFKNKSIPSEVSDKIIKQVEPYQLEEMQEILLTPKELSLSKSSKKLSSKKKPTKANKLSKKKVTSKKKSVNKKVSKKKIINK